MTQFFVDEEREKVYQERLHGFGDDNKTLGYIPYKEIKTDQNSDVEMYLVQCTLHIVLKIYY